MKTILDFIRENWFKLALLAFLLWILINGLNINISGQIENYTSSLPHF
jgi:hypothetical protein